METQPRARARLLELAAWLLLGLAAAAGEDAGEGHVVAAASVVVGDDQERSGQRHVDLAALRLIAVMQPISGRLRGSGKRAFISGRGRFAGPIGFTLGLQAVALLLQHNAVVVEPPGSEPCRERRRGTGRIRRNALLRQPARRAGARVKRTEVIRARPAEQQRAAGM